MIDARAEGSVAASSKAIEMLCRVVKTCDDINLIYDVFCDLEELKERFDAPFTLDLFTILLEKSTGHEHNTKMKDICSFFVGKFVEVFPHLDDA